jgi:phosphatidylinositol alpha 1,6-mannosyltransferase
MGADAGRVRVAIVTESFLPQVNGVTNSVVQVLAHLRRYGIQSLVVAPGSGPDRHEDTPVVRLPAVEFPFVSSMPVGLPTRRVLTALADFKPDLVHLASPFVVGARGLSAARKLGLPTIAVYQTDIAGFAGSYGLGLGARTAWRWTKRLHSLASRTLAPSTWAVRELRERGVPRVHRWGRGVDVERYDPRKRDEALHAQLAPNGELLVGFVGRLAPEKRIDRLSALNNAPGVRLVVVGAGPDEQVLRDKLPGAAFLGMKTGEELARVYASLDVFVHAGPHETFCQTVQEALASGLPAIAPDAGGPSDLIDDGRTGFLLPPWADDEFAAGLRRSVDLLRDGDTRAAFGAAARQAVQARTWPAVCDELLGHYAELLDQPESRCA